MKRTYKYILNLLLAIAVSTAAIACSSSSSDGPDDPSTPPTDQKQVLKSVSYTSTDETFLNPERGYYSQMEGSLTKEVSLASLQALRKKGNTLVMLMYYLTGYNNGPLPEDGLAKIGRDFANVRKAGVKAIVRFAYTNRQEGEDAPMDVILGHLDQLKPVLNDNKDVIACAQAGFIGAWGEWYYSTNKLNNTSSYNKLIKKWLEVLPADRCVQVRTPKYKMDYLASNTPLDAQHAHTATDQARIAHHNDAFMADATNMGTYQDVAADKAYLATDGLYLPVGGETCLPSADAAISKGADAVGDLKKLHWSFLNDLYDQKVLNSWKKDGVGTTIANCLGYRIQLVKGTFSTKHSAGSDLSIRLILQNKGFAAMYNPRKVELVLVSADGKTEYVATLPDDPRTWLPAKTSIVEQTVALPTDIQDGSYKLYLALPDACETLAANAMYSVRLANNGVWDEATGRNSLGVNIAVSKTDAMPASTSSVKFVKRQ